MTDVLTPPSNFYTALLCLISSVDLPMTVCKRKEKVDYYI